MQLQCRQRTWNPQLTVHCEVLSGTRSMAASSTVQRPALRTPLQARAVSPSCFTLSSGGFPTRRASAIAQRYRSAACLRSLEPARVDCKHQVKQLW